MTQHMTVIRKIKLEFPVKSIDVKLAMNKNKGETYI
jgi:hypothetical protein